jgi:hypothetical protein
MRKSIKGDATFKSGNYSDYFDGTLATYNNE